MWMAGKDFSIWGHSCIRRVNSVHRLHLFLWTRTGLSWPLLCVCGWLTYLKVTVVILMWDNVSLISQVLDFFLLFCFFLISFNLLWGDTHTQCLIPQNLDFFLEIFKPLISSIICSVFFFKKMCVLYFAISFIYWEFYAPKKWFVLVVHSPSLTASSICVSQCHNYP